MSFWTREPDSRVKLAASKSRKTLCKMLRSRVSLREQKRKNSGCSIASCHTNPLIRLGTEPAPTGDNTHSSRFRQAETLGTGAGLGVVVVVVMMMVVPSGCERRAGAYQHQKREEDELLHAIKIARSRPVDMTRKMHESSRLRGPRRLTRRLGISSSKYSAFGSPGAGNRGSFPLPE